MHMYVSVDKLPVVYTQFISYYGSRHTIVIYTVKTSWLFQPQCGYPGCRQTGETVVMRGLLL